MSSLVLSVRAGQTTPHPGKEPWPPVIEDADKEIVHPECARLWHRAKKNPVRRLVHSPQKALRRSCAHETPPLFQATENPRWADNSSLERSVCLQQPTKETASFTHLPHHAVEKELTHGCQLVRKVWPYLQPKRKCCRAFITCREAGRCLMWNNLEAPATNITLLILSSRPGRC